MSKWTGLDLALSKPIAICTIGKRNSVLIDGVETKGRAEFSIASEVADKVIRIRPELCAMELMYFGQNPRVYRDMAHLAGMISGILEKSGIRTKSVLANQWRKAVLGAGNAPKKRAEARFIADKLKFVHAPIHATTIKIHLEDIAEAYCLAIWAKMYGKKRSI